MEISKSVGNTAYKLIFFNVIFLLLLLILDSCVECGGTGDLYEGNGLISFYLICKSIALIIYSLVFLIRDLSRKTLKVTKLFWLLYGILLFILAITIINTVNPPVDPRNWGYNDIKYNIFLMNFDYFVINIFSIIISAIAIFQKSERAYIYITSNLVLLILYLFSLKFIQISFFEIIQLENN